MEKKGSLLLGLWEAGLKDPGLPVLQFFYLELHGLHNC